MRQDEALLDVNRLRLAPDQTTLHRNNRSSSYSDPDSDSGGLDSRVHRGTRAGSLTGSVSGRIEGSGKGVRSEFVTVGIQLWSQVRWWNSADTTSKGLVGAVSRSCGRKTHVRNGLMLAHVVLLVLVMCLHEALPKMSCLLVRHRHMRRAIITAVLVVLIVLVIVAVVIVIRPSTWVTIRHPARA